MINIIKIVLYEIPWAFGLGGITLYLIGIAQTIAQVANKKNIHSNNTESYSNDLFLFIETE